jgi:trehalose synthase
MTRPREVPVPPLSISRFLPLVGEERMHEAEQVAAATRARMAGRTLWNVNSTAHGGGVAEMLRPLIGYARGAGVDARWLVVEGTPGFFRVTKRLHHALHGSAGDGSPLGDPERARYERVARANAKELECLIGPDDIVVLHDPQTVGLAPHLVRAGARIIWRCHIGSDAPDDQTSLGWAFLAPYLDGVAATVFSREAYIPAVCDRERAVVIPPSIDPFSAKNQPMAAPAVRAILVHAGLVEGPPGDGTASFLREDGSPGRVNRQADVLRLGRAPTWETPLVVQVSRWDPLKDHLGVMHGFAELVDRTAPADAELVLAGPNVNAVADDPEGASVFGEVVAAWRRLPHADRRRVHLACLPMADAAENAAIVNALQRHAAVVVQKSLREGFGLTVTEAMWKARPVIASAVGGIQDQIREEVDALLIRDPTDLGAFGVALRRLLEDRALAERLGRHAYERARDEYLGLRHLIAYARLLDRVDGDALSPIVTPQAADGDEAWPVPTTAPRGGSRKSLDIQRQR